MRPHFDARLATGQVCRTSGEHTRGEMALSEVHRSKRKEKSREGMEERMGRRVFELVPQSVSVQN